MRVTRTFETKTIFLAPTNCTLFWGWKGQTNKQTSGPQHGPGPLCHLPLDWHNKTEIWDKGPPCLFRVHWDTVIVGISYAMCILLIHLLQIFLQWPNISHVLYHCVFVFTVFLMIESDKKNPLSIILKKKCSPLRKLW